MRQYLVPGLFILLAIASAPAVACSCSRSGNSPCVGINKQSILFLGTVISAENPPSEGDNSGGVARYRIRVDEVFNGIEPEQKEVDVYSGRGGGDCSVWFKVGEQYLVNPGRGTDGRLGAIICSDTRRASGAAGYINQLRARKNGAASAPVFGVLWQMEQPYGSVTDGSPKALGGVRLRLSDAMNTYESVTNADGSYAFASIRPGKYTLSADLPAGLELGHTILDSPMPPTVVKPNSCDEQTLEAVPVSAISGHVVDQAGRFPHYVSVGLYRAGRFREKVTGGFGVWFESQLDDDKEHPNEFRFKHVAPGDYILAANFGGIVDHSEPFERTFYPATTKPEEAQIVHVAQGQSVENLEIVVEAKPSRDIIVRISGVDFKEHEYVSLSSESGPPVAPYQKLSEGVFKITILRGDEFDLFADYPCDLPRDESNRYRPARVKSNQVHVTGDEGSAAEIGLSFDGHSTCEPLPPIKLPLQ